MFGTGIATTTVTAALTDSGTQLIVGTFYKLNFLLPWFLIAAFIFTVWFLLKRFLRLR